MTQLQVLGIVRPLIASACVAHRAQGTIGDGALERLKSALGLVLKNA